MFGFLKDKLKSALNKFSKDVTSEIEEKEVVSEAEKNEIMVEIKSQDKVQDVKISKPEQKKTEKVQKVQDISKAVERNAEGKAAPKADVKPLEPKSSDKKREVKKPSEKPADEIKKSESKKPIVQEKASVEISKTGKPYEVKFEEKKAVITKNEETFKTVLKDDAKIKFEEDVPDENILLKEELVSAEGVPTEAELEEKAEEIVEKENKKKKGFFGKLFSKKSDVEVTISAKESEVKGDSKTLKSDVVEDIDENEKDTIDREVKEDYEDLKEVKVSAKKFDEAKIERELEEAIDDESKKGFFSKVTSFITTKSLNDEKFDELFWELELILLENNVAVEVIEKIKLDLKASVVGKNIRRSEVENVIMLSLKKSLNHILDNGESVDFISKVKEKKPFVICFIGVNGSGKTTTIAKVAYLLKKKNLSCVMAAADTFRAAAIQQLEHHADNVGVKIIKHDYGSDAAAVAFDAINYARAKNIDVVLIDTAGRLHSNTNLMEELKKVQRVSKPDMNIFIGESITGNDCVEQAQKFNEAVGIDGIILSKADVDEKGGAAISVSYVTKKPILFLGSGQEYADLEVYDKEKILEKLGFD